MIMIYLDFNTTLVKVHLVDYLTQLKPLEDFNTTLVKVHQDQKATEEALQAFQYNPC